MLKLRLTETHNLRGYPEAIVGAFRKAGDAYVSDILPKHFTEAGAREYGYEPRDEDYTRRKLQAFGHQRPLEFTGRTRADAMAPGVRSFGHGRGGTGVAVVIDVPTYISGNSDRRRELEATSPRDARDLAKVVEGDLAKKLNAVAPAREI